MQSDIETKGEIKMSILISRKMYLLKPAVFPTKAISKSLQKIEEP